MKRIFAMLLCVVLLLTGCFNDQGEPGGQNVLDNFLDSFQGGSMPDDGLRETVPGTPSHILEWTDPLEGIPQPDQYAFDEDYLLAMSLIGMEPIPPEDELEDAPSRIPTDGLWNTERTYSYQGTLTEENLQDYLAMYARDTDLTAMPPIMEPAAEPIGGVQEEVTLNFYDGYNLQYSLNGNIERIIEKNIDAHNEQLEWGDDAYIDVWFFGQINWELSMVASLTEDGNFEDVASGVSMALGFFGAENVQVLRNAAHDYTITYDGNIEDRCFCDSATGSIQMVKRVGGQVDEIFEFLALEDGRRIWQTNRIRIVAEFEGDNLLRFSYTVLKDGQPDYSTADLVFQDGTACDAAWTTARGEFSQQYVYDGETLTVTWDGHTVTATVR